MSKMETVEVEGPAGRIKINVEDLEMYKARGYEIAGPIETKAGKKTDEK